MIRPRHPRTGASRHRGKHGPPLRRSTAAIVKYRSKLVFARMSPEHKLRLVQAYKAIGAVVAVTGDGVNDAPALRSAHIGIAMGLNGTDVAREAADIVLTDDNFATIVGAIEQGRTVYQNIRKFITYILASNVAELVPFLLMVALKIPPALVIMQILAIDLGTDMVPALALGAEAAETGTMRQPPRAKTQPLMDRALMLRAYCWLGLLEATLGMAGLFWVWASHGYGLRRDSGGDPGSAEPIRRPAPVLFIYAQATTLTLAAIVACQDGNVFACRSERTSIWRLGWFSNPLDLGRHCGGMDPHPHHHLRTTPACGVYHRPPRPHPVAAVAAVSAVDTGPRGTAQGLGAIAADDPLVPTPCLGAGERRRKGARRIG
jgi:magnesium-transporting ATPase (P-type)